jgi:hypothetical protein
MRKRKSGLQHFGGVRGFGSKWLAQPNFKSRESAKKRSILNGEMEVGITAFRGNPRVRIQAVGTAKFQKSGIGQKKGHFKWGNGSRDCGISGKSVGSGPSGWHSQISKVGNRPQKGAF